MYAFGVTEDDVEAVLRRSWCRVGNSDGVAFEAMAAQLLPRLDHNAIERSAIKFEVDLDQQTVAAHAEIDRQLVRMGVLEPMGTEAINAAPIQAAPIEHPIASGPQRRLGIRR